MADTIEQADIRGLQIDTTVKGFGLTEYIFKSDVDVVKMTGESVRWYQETAADLTATAPSVVANVSPLSRFPTLEVSWTRNTSYARKYAVEGFLSMEDINTSDISVLARTVLRLTRAVTKQVDTRIWDVISEGRSAVNINSGASTAAWDAGSGQDPIKDILTMKKTIQDNDFSAEGAILYLNTTDYKNLMTWLISTKGSAIPNFSSSMVSNGTVMSILGVTIKVSTNVTSDYALMMAPGAATWYEQEPLTSKVIDDLGLGKKIRVWEAGECVLHTPKKVYLLTNTLT